MRTLVTTAGALILIAGAMQVWFSIKLRGRGSWRGAVVSGSALAVFGLLALTGVAMNGTALGAGLVWAVAGVTWVGWWLTRRDAVREGR